MNGKEFIRRAQRWAKSHGSRAELEPDRGKGGHQFLRMGERWTVVQTGELRPGVLHAMLKQLGIPKDEF